MEIAFFKKIWMKEIAGCNIEMANGNKTIGRLHKSSCTELWKVETKPQWELKMNECDVCLKQS